MNTDWTDSVRYGRDSTAKQEASLDDQRGWAVAAAAKENIRIVAEFEDHNIPGDEIIRRQGLQELFAFVEAEQKAGRPIACLLVWDLDRLSRSDSVKAAVIIDRLREAGVTRVFCQEGWLDLNDEITMTLNHIKQDFSRKGYSKSISRNVSRKCLERAQRGRWCGGRPPYGYAIVGAKSERHLVRDETEGGVRPDTVTWLFAAYRDRDTSLCELAKELTRRGVPPPKGTKEGPKKSAGYWTPAAVWTILKNPLYTGAMHYGRRGCGKHHRVVRGAVQPARPQRTRGGRVRWESNPEESHIIVPDAHPALTDSATFDAVAGKLRGHRPGLTKGTTRRCFQHIFGGLLRCVHCGEMMWGGGGAGREYLCSSYRQFGSGTCTYNHADERQLLRLVAVAIRDHFADPKVLTEVKERIRLKQRASEMESVDLLPKWQAKADELKASIAQGTVRLAKVPDDLLEAVVAQLREWKQQLAEAQAEIAALKVAKQSGQQVTELAEAGLARLKELPEIIDRAAPSLLREMLRTIIAEIELTFKAMGPDAQGRPVYRLSHGTIHTTPLAQLVGVPPNVLFDDTEAKASTGTSSTGRRDGRYCTGSITIHFSAA